MGGFPNNGNGGVATYDAVLANGSTITLDQNITIQRFTLSSGTVTGTFNLILNDNLAWTGGTMSGTGTTSVAGAGSTISGSESEGAGPDAEQQRDDDLQLAPTAAPLYFGARERSDARRAQQQRHLQRDRGRRLRADHPNAGHAINNSGTWNVSGAGTTSNVSAGIAFNNTGAVNVTSGTLALDGGGTSTGSFAISAGATLQLRRRHASAG